MLYTWLSLLLLLLLSVKILSIDRASTYWHGLWRQLHVQDVLVPVHQLLFIHLLHRFLQGQVGTHGPCFTVFWGTPSIKLCHIVRVNIPDYCLHFYSQQKTWTCNRTQIKINIRTRTVILHDYYYEWAWGRTHKLCYWFVDCLKGILFPIQIAMIWMLLVSVCIGYRVRNLNLQDNVLCYWLYELLQKNKGGRISDCVTFQTISLVQTMRWTWKCTTSTWGRVLISASFELVTKKRKHVIENQFTQTFLNNARNEQIILFWFV